MDAARHQVDDAEGRASQELCQGRPTLMGKVRSSEQQCAHDERAEATKRGDEETEDESSPHGFLLNRLGEQDCAPRREAPPRQGPNARRQALTRESKEKQYTSDETEDDCLVGGVHCSIRWCHGGRDEQRGHGDRQPAA